MTDVLGLLLCLANQTGVNLTEAFEKNLEKKTKRDKERHIKTINLNKMDTINSGNDKYLKVLSSYQTNLNDAEVKEKQPVSSKKKWLQ